MRQYQHLQTSIHRSYHCFWYSNCHVMNIDDRDLHDFGSRGLSLIGFWVVSVRWKLWENVWGFRRWSCLYTFGILIVGDIGLVYDFMFGSYGVIGVVWFFLEGVLNIFGVLWEELRLKIMILFQVDVLCKRWGVK